MQRGLVAGVAGAFTQAAPGSLASATALVRGLARCTGHGQGRKLLGSRGVDAHGVDDRVVRRAQLQRDREALRDLARVGSQHVEADDAQVV